MSGLLRIQARPGEAMKRLSPFTFLPSYFLFSLAFSCAISFSLQVSMPARTINYSVLIKIGGGRQAP